MAGVQREVAWRGREEGGGREGGEIDGKGEWRRGSYLNRCHEYCPLLDQQGLSRSCCQSAHLGKGWKAPLCGPSHSDILESWWKCVTCMTTEACCIDHEDGQGWLWCNIRCRNLWGYLGPLWALLSSLVQACQSLQQGCVPNRPIMSH